MHCQKPFIIAGDFNAHHSIWGSHKDDRRGKIIESIVSDQELIILNDGSPTFVHPSNRTGMQSSTTSIDLTLCTAELADKLNWVVSQDQHGSDHFPILIGTSPSNKRHRTAKWKIHEANWEVFERTLEDTIQPSNSYSVNDAIRAKLFPKHPRKFPTRPCRGGTKK